MKQNINSRQIKQLNKIFQYIYAEHTILVHNDYHKMQ